MTAAPGRSTIWPAIVAVAAVQTAILAWMVWERVSLLRTGREVTVDVVPIDPRSLFRGDYVRFNFDFSRVAPELLPEPPERGRPVYVLIEKGQGDKWRPVKASAAPIIAGADQTHVVLKGRLEGWWRHTARSTTPVPVRYGIESYFVPEGEGQDLEALVREKRISVLLAVAADGTAAIKGILADGQPIAREKPL
jgi:uncharacterized membrane-anchored protein